jgi:hypothetical protein
MFLILIKFHELCWYFYLQVHIWDKKGVTRPHQVGAAEPAGAAGTAGAASPAPATIRVPTITTSTNTLCMDRIHRGYVGLIQRV